MTSKLSSPPTQAEVLTEQTIYLAVKDLELMLFGSEVPTEAIFAGFQNDISLPAGNNEYVVNTIISHIDHGTPCVDYELNPDTQEMRAVVSKLEEVVVQVDCYSDFPEKARIRCLSLAAITRTTPIVDFMQQYGLSSLYAGQPRNTTVVVDAEKYVQRWTTEIHLSFTHRVALDVDSFDAVKVVIANVDVRFPPKQ